MSELELRIDRLKLVLEQFDEIQGKIEICKIDTDSEPTSAPTWRK